MTSPGEASKNARDGHSVDRMKADDLKLHFHVAAGVGGVVPLAYGMTSGGMVTGSVASLHGPRSSSDLGINTRADILATLVRVEDDDPHSITISLIFLRGEVERADHDLLRVRSPKSPVAFSSAAHHSARPSFRRPSFRRRPSFPAIMPPPVLPHSAHHSAACHSNHHPPPMPPMAPIPPMPRPIIPPIIGSFLGISFFSLGTRLAM